MQAQPQEVIAKNESDSKNDLDQEAIFYSFLANNKTTYVQVINVILPWYSMQYKGVGVLI